MDDFRIGFENFERRAFEDSYFGISLHWTKAPGIGGSIKQKLEDFVVEEIPLEFEKGDAGVAFLVEKRGLDTFETIHKIARALGVNKRAIGYAGLKDRYAITRQWMSVVGVSEDQLKKINVPGLAVLQTRRITENIHLGDLVGNRFTVVIRGIKLDTTETRNRLETLTKEIQDRGIPNFFGPQRFGQNRPVTHLVGKKIVRGDLDGAVFDYLTLDFPGETEEIRSARRRLAKEQDFKKALEYFPRGMAYERMLLRVLSEGGSAMEALRALPAGLNKLFIDACQSYIFNTSMSRFLQNKDSITNFPAPVVGYRTVLTSNEFDSVVQKVLVEEGISEENFFVQKMPELSAKGTLRSALIYPRIECTIGNGFAKLVFELKKGSYATVVLREIMKPAFQTVP